MQDLLQLTTITKLKGVINLATHFQETEQIFVYK